MSKEVNLFDNDLLTDNSNNYRKRQLKNNFQGPEHKRNNYLEFSPRFSSALNMDEHNDLEGNSNGLLTNSINEIAGQSSSTLNDIIKCPNKQTNGLHKQPLHSTSLNGSTKKIIIRKFQYRNDPNVLNFDANWSILQDSVIKIQRKERVSVTCVELYNIVENLCQMNYAQEIFSRLQILIYNFSDSECLKLVEGSQNCSSETFLIMLNRLWDNFCQQLSLTRSVFLYLDRTYRVQQNTSGVSIWDTGHEAFRKRIIERFGICSRAVNGILKLIEKDRREIQVDKHLLKSLLRMFINLQIYDFSFEKEFLKETELFYFEESSLQMQELTINNYLQFAQKRLLEEEERVQYYLEYSTAKKLIGIVENCFIANYLDSIIAKGPYQLISEQKLDDLALLYKLVSRVKDGQLALKNAFSDHIKKIGRALVMDSERDKTLVQELIDLKSQLDQIILKCFCSNEKFLNALKDSFDFFINSRANKIAELTAKFMDLKLRTGNKECTEEELDSVMDRVIVIFRFVQGKDVFEAFYKKDLAKRLLLGRSASVDAEKAMLSKLRTECGAGLTQKLEGMFKDMELSKDFCATFKQYLEASDKEKRFSKLEVNIAVLTMGNWPTYPLLEVNIPPQLAELQQICSKFYTSKHNGRKLQWQYTLASGVLKATFKSKVIKELEVSLFQAMVLLLFNEKIKWNFKEIAENTKIEDTELKRTLQSLACGKFRVLHKQPKGKDVNSDDNFIFNEEFNDRLYRIRISQVQMKETEQEHQQTEEQIYQDRLYQIDAAIVRIMKTRQKMSHTQLITETLSQLRFSVKATDLKKRIESLIEREYLNRDKEDANNYNYVA
ncbi:CULLIN_2 domain-containing protein [Meloidogyne graminicola]|uniref:Cullin-4 n=1 Tax=Meloidogyne graminicola TaxID=189291 RepID=A0A8S9ZJC7_9BILA|nr:CULLIN_2 domain-containing protein [Meloidogyne graminicola]